MRSQSLKSIPSGLSWLTRTSALVGDSVRACANGGSDPAEQVASAQADAKDDGAENPATGLASQERSPPKGATSSSSIAHSTSPRRL